ncbi:3-demethylubiquinone-9 3-methyltransferase [Corynebacterium glaucum]|uniref:VOC family protein n=1 Tax=Corynebacterium glaucum TaxID=187491 RepID=UPI0025B4FE8D|nr:VOC family protein [Corynebacterium glaucum]WJZ06843.1 3-demethylubiquinone-9 3-methyltransferase [Corynebacterium glaucum]
MLSDSGAAPRPFIMPAVMFDGPAQDRAEEAAEFYVKLFNSSSGQEAEVGGISRYPERTGKAEAGALAFGEFRVGDQWFVVMDNGSGQDHGLRGISLLVNCEVQKEIDFFWDSLSADSDAENCGWLKDKFGMSWQIVPVNHAELLRHPNAFAHMMEMKKLVIADF